MKIMKKVLGLVLGVMILLSVTGCGDGGDTKTISLNKLTLEMTIGSSFTLVATTDPEDAVVTYSSSNTDAVTVSSAGVLYAANIGTATITASLEGNEKATCEVTVKDEDIPVAPTGAKMLPTDFVKQEVAGTLTVAKTGTVTKLSYNALAAADTSWENKFIQNAQGADEDSPDIDYTRYTKFGFYARANEGQTLYVNAYSSDGAVWEGEVTVGKRWTKFEHDFTSRWKLANIECVTVYAPKPGSNVTKDGFVEIVGVWFDGDADAEEEPNYIPEDYTIVHDIDLSTFANPDLSYLYYGDLTGEVDGVDASYVEGEGIVIENTINDWKSLDVKLPEYYNDVEIDYTGATKVVIEIDATAGAWVKAKYGNNDDATNIFEVKFAADGKKYIVIDVGEVPVAAWAYVQIAPTYMDGDATSTTVTIVSVQLVKEKANA